MTIVGALPFTLQNGTTADATQVMADFNSIKTDVNANAAAAGANNDITSLAGLTTPLSVAQGGSGSAAPAPFVFTGGYRNIARRNGGLEVWQRGAGGAASFAVGASTTAYTADGWYLKTAANQASGVFQQIGRTGGSQWCAKIQRNNGQTGTGTMFFGFPLDTDELYPMLGQFVRLSLTLQAGANWSPASGAIGFSVRCGTAAPAKFSGGYTSGTAPIDTSVNITTSAVRYQATSTVFIPTNTRQAEICLTWVPVGTAGVDDSFYIDDVQLEIVPAVSGYTASDFERLLFQEQLDLCKRHYQKTFPYTVAPANNAGSTNGAVYWIGISAAQPNLAFWNLPVPLRLETTASCTAYNPSAANSQIRNLTDGADFSGTIVNQLNESVIEPAGTVNGGMGANDNIAVHVTADAGI